MDLSGRCPSPLWKLTGHRQTGAGNVSYVGGSKTVFGKSV